MDDVLPALRRNYAYVAGQPPELPAVLVSFLKSMAELIAENTKTTREFMESVHRLLSEKPAAIAAPPVVVCQPFDGSLDRNMIYALRRSKNLTQEALGDYIGVSRSLISQWEQGKMFPIYENIVRLAACLGCDADDLALNLRRIRFADRAYAAAGERRVFHESDGGDSR
ncbi:hypothetical protein FACS18949_07730 [Clostridia bacterium]|nr:hypothetical protein FACS18949_07730 [Clostridia bacterium]